MHLQESILFGLDLGVGVKVTQNVAEYATHNIMITYARAKFEVAMSNG